MKQQLLLLLLAGYTFAAFAQQSIQIIQPRQQKVGCENINTILQHHIFWVGGHRIICGSWLPAKVLEILPIMGGTPCEFTSEEHHFVFPKYVSRHHESKRI